MNLDAIAGVAHEPAGTATGTVLLTHGAGGNRDAPLLVALCEKWAQQGWLAIRYDLPFRRRRPTGPPPSSAAADRAGIAEAIALAGTLTPGPVIAGGHSYGGRMTSMAAAAGAEVAVLALSSFPLHPPGKPDRTRTGHFGAIRVPTVFTQGSRDPFGSLAELEAAAALVPAPTEIVAVDGAGHDLGFTPRTPAGPKVTDVTALAVGAALRLGGFVALR